jgi:CHAD domain-containing protein
VLEERKELDGVAAALKKARRRSRDWGVTGGAWDVVSGGLRQVYRAGRQALRAAQAETNDETLHEWRKQSKYLRHALELLEPLGDAAVKGARENAHDLGDQLGDDHDLAVLAGLLESEGGRLAGGAAATLRPVIDRRRAELQRDAFALGADLYRRRPKAFAGRLWPYWHGWRATGAAGGRAHSASSSR